MQQSRFSPAEEDNEYVPTRYLSLKESQPEQAQERKRHGSLLGRLHHRRSNSSESATPSSSPPATRSSLASPHLPQSTAPALIDEVAPGTYDGQQYGVMVEEASQPAQVPGPGEERGGRKRRGLPKLLRALRPKLSRSGGSNSTLRISDNTHASPATIHHHTTAIERPILASSPTRAVVHSTMAAPTRPAHLIYPSSLPPLRPSRSEADLHIQLPRPLVSRSSKTWCGREMRMEDDKLTPTVERPGYHFPPWTRGVDEAALAPLPLFDLLPPPPSPPLPLRLPSPATIVDNPAILTSLPLDVLEALGGARTFTFKARGRRNSYNSFSQSSFSLDGEGKHGSSSPHERSHWSTNDYSSEPPSRRGSLGLAQDQSPKSATLVGPVLQSKFSDWTLSTSRSSLPSLHHNDSSPSLRSSNGTNSSSSDSAAERLNLGGSRRRRHHRHRSHSRTNMKSIAMQTDLVQCDECEMTWNEDEETSRGPTTREVALLGAAEGGVEVGGGQAEGGGELSAEPR